MVNDISRKLARKVQLVFTIINAALFVLWIVGATLLWMHASAEELALYVVAGGCILSLLALTQLLCCWMPGQRRLRYNTWFLRRLQKLYCDRGWCLHEIHSQRSGTPLLGIVIEYP